MNSNLTMFMRATRGAPLTILFTMLLLNRMTGVNELQTLTSYDPKTIRAGLQTLAALGLAASADRRRYNRWHLTDKGRQLPLQGLTVLEEPIHKNENEGEFLPLPGSSSGLLKESSLNEDSLKPPLLLEARGNFSPSPVSSGPNQPPPEAQEHLIDVLVRCGCPTKTAAAATIKALQSGDDPIELEIDALRWLSYCLSEHGQGIHSKGHFIAAKIAQAEPCPDWFEPDENTQREIDRLTNGNGWGGATCTYCDRPAIPGPTPPMCEEHFNQFCLSQGEIDQ